MKSSLNTACFLLSSHGSLVMPLFSSYVKCLLHKKPISFCIESRRKETFGKWLSLWALMIVKASQVLNFQTHQVVCINSVELLYVSLTLSDILMNR